MKEKILSFFSFFTDTVLNLLPDNPWTYLAYLGGVVVISFFMIFYLARRASRKKSEKKDLVKEITIDDLLKIANNPKSTTKDLLSALMLYNEKFVIEQHKEKSFELFEKILNHKNRNKSLFDYFHGNILPKNIRHKDELDALEKKALNKK